MSINSSKINHSINLINKVKEIAKKGKFTNQHNNNNIKRQNEEYSIFLYPPTFLPELISDWEFSLIASYKKYKVFHKKILSNKPSLTGKSLALSNNLTVYVWYSDKEHFFPENETVFLSFTITSCAANTSQWPDIWPAY